MKIYLPKKVTFTLAAKPRLISLSRVDKSLCLPKLKSLTVLLYDFLTINKNLGLGVMFNLRTFSQVLATVIKILLCNTL